jgi:hypothetical protein
MDLLILDCTYKTNRFQMPLLNAIILTGMNTVLPFAQVWLPGESEPDFTRALSQLKTLMIKNDIPLPSDRHRPRPSLYQCAGSCFSSARQVALPLAHQTQCTRPSEEKNRHDSELSGSRFFHGNFDATVDAATEDEFIERCVGLRRLSDDMANYLDRNWWPYK